MHILASYLVWPGLVLVPLVLTHSNLYSQVFPSAWYDGTATNYLGHSQWPSPLGLSLGLLTVVVGQIGTLLYFTSRKFSHLGKIQDVQKEGARAYEFTEGLLTHLAQPEGFILLGAYLIGSWMFGLMPSSYYSFAGGINWMHVALQLLIQDTLMFVSHFLEHRFKQLYRVSHKPHHRFINPRLFDAFNGSTTDTVLMILIPLMITARLVDTNVWSYMAFGSIYANWLTLIHSEFAHPWDGCFRMLGMGTSADHHVHHKLFTFNYGHLFL